MVLNGDSLIRENKSIDSIHHVEVKNPLRDDAFEKKDKLKVQLISRKFKEILEILGLDLNDDSIRDTPNRVAKMYVNEIFKG